MKPSPHRRLLRRLAVVASIALSAGIVSVASAAPASARFPKTVAADVVALGHGRHAAPALGLPFRANLIGVSYVGTATIEVRTRTPKGAWSDWQRLEPSDNGTDAGTAEAERAEDGRTTTEPVWAGTIDRVELKIDSAAGVHDVRIHAVNTLGDSRPQSSVARVVGAIGHWLVTPFARASVASAAPAAPSVVTRAQWGANESWRQGSVEYAKTVEVAFVHHTDTSNAYTQAQVPGIIQGIYHYHRFSRDYNDIAYNFLIDRFGVVYEGRFGGIDKPVVGAHVEGMNTATTGIALIGTFQDAYPTGPMMIALEKLLAWKMDLHHIPVTGTVPMTSSGSAKLRKGQVVNMNRVSGHRDAQLTTCPGNKVYAQLANVRSTAQSWGYPKFYMNSSPRILRNDGDGVDDSASIKVWNSAPSSWSASFSDASGTVVSTQTGTGSTWTASWDGAAAASHATTGIGQISIDVWDSNNRHATRATIPLYVVDTHPAGTILKSGSTVVYVDANGNADPVPSGAVYDSWFRADEAVTTAPGELAKYAAGPVMSYRDGTILKTPDGEYHFVYAGQRRDFAPGAFTALGFADAAAIAVQETDADALPPGPQIADTTQHPDGTVVRSADGSQWLITGGQKRPFAAASARKSAFRDAEVVAATPADDALPEGARVPFRDGSILKTPDGNYWFVWNGTRRWFQSRWFMDALGYSTKAALPVSWPENATLAYGTPIA